MIAGPAHGQSDSGLLVVRHTLLLILLVCTRCVGLSVAGPVAVRIPESPSQNLQVNIIEGSNQNTKGLNIGLLNRVNDRMVGLQVGLYNLADRLEGLQFGYGGRARIARGAQMGAGSFAGSIDGAQISIVLNIADEIRGVQLALVGNGTRHAESAGQLALVNWSDSRSLFQIGLVNVTDGQALIQVGLLNVATDNPVPFFPFINIGPFYFLNDADSADP